VEEEQHRARRAGYGEELIRNLAQRPTRAFGWRYSRDNLVWFRRFLAVTHSTSTGYFKKTPRHPQKNSQKPVDARYQLVLNCPSEAAIFRSIGDDDNGTAGNTGTMAAGRLCRT
jgi:hypothetical protein